MQNEVLHSDQKGAKSCALDLKSCAEKPNALRAYHFKNFILVFNLKSVQRAKGQGLN